MYVCHRSAAEPTAPGVYYETELPVGGRPRREGEEMERASERRVMKLVTAFYGRYANDKERDVSAAGGLSPAAAADDARTDVPGREI